MIKNVYINTIINGLQELKNRLFFLFLFVFIFRIGVFIPIPGINTNIFNNLFIDNHNTFWDVFNMFSGGSLIHSSIFALGIIPYISSSIIIQLFTILFPKYLNTKKEGVLGRYKISMYTKYLTLFLSIFQSICISTAILNFNNFSNIIIDNNFSTYFLSILSLVTGTMFLMWLGDQISERGLGNGVSVIIFIGIVSNLPNFLFYFLRNFNINYIYLVKFIFIIFFIFCTIFFIVFVEMAQRKILVYYASRRYIQNKYFFSTDTFLPFKVNMSGVIPVIFSSSILSFTPFFIFWINRFFNYNFFDYLAVLFLPKYIFNSIFSVFFIIFFSFFYTLLMYNSDDISNNLRKTGAYIPGIRPGKSTSIFLNKIILRITLFGSLYISIICLAPDFIYSILNIPIYFSGTSLLIVVVVIMEFISQIQSLVMSNKYFSIIKKKY